MSGGGGGGGGDYYQNLDQLYAIQAEQARQLMGLAQTSVYPQYQTFVNRAMDYGSQANQERQAATAGADALAAGQAQQQAMQSNLMSMGVNPADSRYASNTRTAGIQNAGQVAASMTGARDNTRNVGFARQQDAIGLGMGVPSNATAAAQGAASTASTAANLDMQNQQMATQNTANTVRGAMNLYTMAGYKDGGFVAKRYASGGIIGAMPTVGAPPSRGVQRPTGEQQAIGAATSGLQGYRTGQGLVNTTAKGINALGHATDSQGLGALGKGLNAGSASSGAANAGPPIDAMATATQQVDKALPSITGAAADGGVGGASAAGAGSGAAGAAGAGSSAAGAAGAAGADAAASTAGAAIADSAATAAASSGATAAAGTGAATAGAAGALGTAGAAIGAAMPWVGAALAVGSALDLFADGGYVYAKGGPVSEEDGEPMDRVDGEHGGAVDGPGGPKDDKIPAWLSDGEFVMPVGAVQLFGVHRLEKMRQQGLEHERNSGMRG